MFNIGILWWAGIEGRGKKKTGEGGKNSPILLARFDFPQLFDVFRNMAVTRAERFGHSKKTHENVNFDLFLYSVQPQLPFTGESSYSINISGGNASIGDHSVTNVGTATPRWRIPKWYLLCNDHWAPLVDYKELFFNSMIAKRPYTNKASVCFRTIVTRVYM